MRTLAEIVRDLKEELSRMPAFKRGSRWEGDRIRELVRLEGRLAEAQMREELSPD